MLFKFDSTAANVYTGASERTLEEWTKTLKSLGVAKRGTIEGSNLLDLLGEIGRHTEGRTARIVLRVYTDAGIDGITEGQLQNCRKILDEWKAQGRVESFTMIGVKPEWRHQLVKHLGDSIRFEEL
jgi:hypothetical protein